MTAQPRSLAIDAQQVVKAMELIQLGARMQVLESEIPSMSRDRLLRLYREVRGESPPKGMLPYSADWYLTWGPNAHASLFYNIYSSLMNYARLEKVDLLIKSYRLYAEHFSVTGEPRQMDLTRAWTLVRFFEAGILQRATCTRCGGRFVAHQQDLVTNLVCGLCQPPSRAGKTKARKAVH